MSISINTSLFAHIELDSELSGRFGVEGNTFSNTFGYLNQYLKTLKNIPPKVKKLAVAMDDLVTLEKEIKAIMSNTLDSFTVKIAKKITDLRPGQPFLIPGGWRGIESSGHGMIYQFEKDEQGELFFSIYNSGSGIERHQQTSSTEKELYSAVKVYKLPSPVHPDELQSFIKRLTIPRLASMHPARNARHFDANELYTDIETSLEFMNAEFLPHDINKVNANTGGQLSGTCTQRSIHQVLKVNFDSLFEYQRFIFGFKVHALKEFIATHPLPRSPQITELIQKAISNNFRIAQEPGVFEDADEQAQAVNLLRELNKRSETEYTLHRVGFLWRSFISSFWNLLVSFQSNGINLVTFLFSTTRKTSLNREISPFETRKQTESNLPPPLLAVDKNNLLSDLALVIARCKEQQATNSAWVMAQIEQTILALPIPASTSLAPPYYESISFYQTINTAEDFDTIGLHLDELHQIYLGASNQLLKGATVPSQVVTYCSLLALRDYFDATGVAVTGKPAFHTFLHTFLFRYLNSFRGHPFLATNSPERDKRLMDLLTLTYHGPTNQGSQKLEDLLEIDPYLKSYLEQHANSEDDKDKSKISRCRSHILLSPDQNLKVNLNNYKVARTHRNLLDKQIPPPEVYYQMLLDSEPDLKKRLEALFNAREYSNARLYEELRWNKLTALYVLLGELNSEGELKVDSLLSPEEFEPLIKKMKQHFTLERVLTSYLEPLKSKTKEKIIFCLTPEGSHSNRTVSPWEINEHSSYESWVDTFIDLKYCDYPFPLLPHEKASITQHKYALTPSMANSALLFTHVYNPANDIELGFAAYKSNRIQLLPNENTASIDKSSYFSRDLFHLRTSPGHQIKLTLDYFSKPESMVKLRDPNIKLYVEANLCEPTLLIAALADDSTFLTRFNRFIEMGLRSLSNVNGSMNAEFLFFIRLRTKIYTYAALNHPEGEVRHLLRSNHDTLSNLIAVKQDPAVLAGLHTCRFLNAVTLYQQEGLNLRLLEDALFSNFYAQAIYNPFSPKDTASHFEQEQARVYFNEGLRLIEPAVLHTFIHSTMHKLGLNVHDLNLVGTYPCFYYQDLTGANLYTVNAEQGRVYQNAYVLNSIPLDIKTHPIIERLGLQNETSCWISEDKQLMRFNSGTVRLKKMGQRLVVQKKWRQEDQWYQLIPLNPSQQDLFQLNENFCYPDFQSINELASILCDGSCEAWTNEQATVIARHNKPIYQIDKMGVIHQLNEQGELNGFTLSKPPSHYQKALARFESPDFFTVALNKAIPKKGTIDFPRYGFSLDVVGTRIKRSGTEYTLNKSTPLGSEIAALAFSNGTEEQCLVAVQPFYVQDSTPQLEGEYYKLTQDISGHIPKSIIWNERHKKISSTWLHYNSQRTIIYKMVQGKPKPATAAEALYLCYLYLASHETEKAWEVLEELSNTLSCTGSRDELLYLSWIVTALPTVLNEEKDAERQFQTPEYVSCQLKALAYYVDFLKLGTAPKFPGNKVDFTYANGFYEQKCEQQLKTFKGNLSSVTAKLYSIYQRQSRHRFERYTLNDSECITLLNYGDPNQEDSSLIAYGLEDCTLIAYGSMGYERRRFSLKILLKEYQRLLAVQDTSTHFPPSFATRLTDIESHITHELQVMKKNTKLQWTVLDLNFYKPTVGLSQGGTKIPNGFDDEDLSPLARECFREWKSDVFSAPKDIDYALKKLHSEIKQDDFFQFFPTYLHVACSGTAEQQARLKAFCIHYLIGFRHTSTISKQGSMRFLSNILYRLLEAPISVPNEKWLLDDLLKQVCGLTVTPIRFAKAKNVFDEILTTNKDLWDTLSVDNATYEPMPVLAALHPEPLWQLLGMKDALQAYRDAENTYQRLMREVKDEQKAGQMKLNASKRQKELAERIFADIKLCNELTQRASSLSVEQKVDLNERWDRTLDYANQAPQNAIKVLAKQAHALTKEELLSLYLHADLALYIEQTGLSKEVCLSLHQLIHESVSLEVQHQQVTRLLEVLPQGQPHQIAMVLMNENLPEVQIDSGLMLFQYAENILLRPRQKEALTSLLSVSDEPPHFNNVVEKVIMGGGKSKVILPLLAEKKATGLNLVVVEVPRALLATNHVDLNVTSQRLFGQKAHRFEFNRDSDCSSAKLQSIYQAFTGIMINKEYLVTTGEAMQSLELKYLELLLSRPESSSALTEWHKQVYWASKITSLVKSCGDVVIDEVHQGLLLKKKLNYTLGDLVGLSPLLIQESIALYQFVEHLHNPYPSIDALLFHPYSPLKELITELKRNHPAVDIDKNLKAYFENKSAAGFIEQAAPQIKEKLAFYKAQLTLMPRTQARHFKEHYGPSCVQKTALQCALAIPYSASNQPSERSRFGNFLETINYSIQSLLIEGLNEELLTSAIQHWQSSAEAEFICATLSSTLNDTATAKRINKYLQGTDLTLGAINVRTEQGKNELLSCMDRLKRSPSLLYAILEELILPQIVAEPAVLHSDAYNHVDLYHSAQGVSGTPWNHSTYHQRLKFNPNTSLGTDGYIQAVLKEQNTSVVSVPFTTLQDFIATLFKSQPNVRAIIDISATFAGFSNLEVARALTSKVDSDIQYILYFNEQDILCALNVRTLQFTLLASSDPDEIRQKTGCTPNECFTYYDQSHTVGTDLKQTLRAQAFVLADKRTQLESFLQGCLRMRGMDEQQKLSIIVPEDTPTKLNELLALMAKNEQEQLQEDNFNAALAKMTNLIRQDFLQRLARIPDHDVDKKYKMAQAFKPYFVEMQAQNLFEQYGGLYVERLTFELFKEYHEHLVSTWKHCLELAEATPSQEELKTLSSSLNDIAQTASSLCHEYSMSRNQQTQALGVEVEHEQEKAKEMEKEQLNEAERFESSLKSAPHHSWSTKEKDLDSPFESFAKQGTSNFLCPLNEAANSHYFSANLLVDDNYAKVYEHQKQMLGPFLKPVLPILFRQCGDMVTACLIDMDDLVELHPLLQSGGDVHLWISTTQHEVLSGTPPDGIRDNKEYQSLVEQIKLFNGELSSLSAQKEPWCWLNENSSEKLAYFHEHLMPYRQTGTNELHHLQSQLVTEKNSLVGAIDNKPSDLHASNMRLKEAIHKLRDDRCDLKVSVRLKL